jgi:hypothetical protein
MDGMVEKVAAAFWNATHPSPADWNGEAGPSLLERERMMASARAAIAAMHGWQPIETAPKDGTQILAFAKGYGSDFYGVCQWAEADPDFPRTVSGWFWSFAIRPTYWQPLPAPPSPDRDRVGDEEHETPRKVP